MKWMFVVATPDPGFRPRATLTDTSSRLRTAFFGPESQLRDLFVDALLDYHRSSPTMRS
jgi:hypothetical protein